ncbi:MAG TPA: PEGA domain-containing protein [Terriglobia bacterium]|nr:PEGA domain-containing protein [Terriglobia bacterium]
MSTKSSTRGNLSGSWRCVVALKAIVMCALATLVFVSIAAAQKATKPLSKDDVVGLLEGQVEPARVADVARSEGITFEMNSAAEKELRDAGADEHLISVLRDLAPKPKSEPAAPANSPPSSAPPILLIEASPGGAQVYIDDEPKATTSPEGRVRFSELPPGLHVVRLSVVGYSDYEQKVELKPGQTSTVYATLAAVKAASTPSYTPPAASQSGGNAAAANINPASGRQTNPANNPNVARFLVAHDHGFPAGLNLCIGWMTVGNGKIHFQGVRAMTNGQVGGPTHSFDISGDEIKEARRNGVYLAQMGGFHLKLKKGTNINMYVVDAQGRYQPPDTILTAIQSQMNISLK